MSIQEVISTLAEVTDFEVRTSCIGMHNLPSIVQRLQAALHEILQNAGGLHILITDPLTGSHFGVEPLTFAGDVADDSDYKIYTDCDVYSWSQDLPEGKSKVCLVNDYGGAVSITTMYDSTDKFNDAVEAFYGRQFVITVNVANVHAFKGTFAKKGATLLGRFLGQGFFDITEKVIEESDD